jgi:hypothetical protein
VLFGHLFATVVGEHMIHTCSDGGETIGESAIKIEENGIISTHEQSQWTNVGRGYDIGSLCSQFSVFGFQFSVLWFRALGLWVLGFAVNDQLPTLSTLPISNDFLRNSKKNLLNSRIARDASYFWDAHTQLGRNIDVLNLETSHRLHDESPTRQTQSRGTATSLFAESRTTWR